MPVRRWPEIALLVFLASAATAAVDANGGEAPAALAAPTTTVLTLLHGAGSIDLTAMVTVDVADPISTGTVNFRSSATSITGCENVALNEYGLAVCSPPAGAFSGGESLTAEYSGSPDHNAGTSAPVLFPSTACAPNPVVTSTADAGPDSLRQAILDVCPGDTITFDLGADPATIELTSGTLLLARDVTIDGPGATLLTVTRSSGSFRIFTVGWGRMVTFRGLTISNGLALNHPSFERPYPTGLGGGIYNDHGRVTVVETAISGNTAAHGGGVYNDSRVGVAALSIVRSTVSANHTNSSGGGIYTGSYTAPGPTGGDATLTIDHSTVSGNTSAGLGGGINRPQTADVNALIITNSTITLNRARSTEAAGTNVHGGGLGSTPQNPVLLRNSIVAGNLRGSPGNDVADDASRAHLSTDR